MSLSILTEPSTSIDPLCCGQNWFDSDVEEVRPLSPEQLIAKKTTPSTTKSILTKPHYYGQNWLDSDVEEVRAPSPDQVSTKKKSIARTSKKRRADDDASTSFIITKSSRPGHRLVKIEVLDLTRGSSESECVVIKTQYVVMDPVDEIMDLTEHLVRKISKTMCNNNTM